MLHGIEIDEGKRNDLAIKLEGMVKAVYTDVMIDDLQEEFTGVVEFEPMPGDTRGMACQAYYTRERVYEGKEKLEAFIRRQACENMASQILSILKFADYLGVK